MVDTELRQLIEQGYVATTLRCSHDPWAFPMPDAQGGIPTIMMEMLLYSRPGVIEVLPALPETLVKGSINGMLARTFARIDKLAWNMEARTVELTVTSFRRAGRHFDRPLRHRRDHRIRGRAGCAAQTRTPPTAICTCPRESR